VALHRYPEKVARHGGIYWTVDPYRCMDAHGRLMHLPWPAPVLQELQTCKVRGGRLGPYGLVGKAPLAYIYITKSALLTF
jgi:hypothetical protein